MIRKILVVSLLMIVFMIFACGKQELTAPELPQNEDAALEGPSDQQTGRPEGLSGGFVLFGASYSGPDDPAIFHAIDPTTGAATAIGPIGFERVGGMDFHPVTGVLYAAGERVGSSTPVLITIDVTTGAGTEVGPTGINGTIGDVSFRADGTLFVYDAIAFDHTLYTADLSTGAATLVGSTGLSSNSGNGIAFKGRDLRDAELLHSNRDFSHTLSQFNGSATQVASLSYTTTCASSFPRIAAADMHHASGVVMGIIKCGFSGVGSERLGTVNYTTGVVTEVGITADGMDALAFIN